MKAPLAPATAKITSCTATRSGLALAASGEYEPGIGGVSFAMIDLSEHPAAVVDSYEVDYCTPLPPRIREEWTSGTRLTGTPCCVVFHVYDRAGVNLVADDRHDFRLDPSEEKP